MIDDKKIEEATRNYINKNGYFIKYDEEPCIDIEFAYREGYKDGCKDTINEFLKNLWHHIEEKPEKEKVFLYQSSCYGFGLKQISDTKDWDFIIKYQKAIQWLYIDDLISKI